MNLKHFITEANKRLECSESQEHYWTSCGEPRASGGDWICVTFECKNCTKRVYEFLNLEEYHLCEKQFSK